MFRGGAGEGAVGVVYFVIVIAVSYFRENACMSVSDILWQFCVALALMDSGVLKIFFFAHVVQDVIEMCHIKMPYKYVT